MSVADAIVVTTDAARALHEFVLIRARGAFGVAARLAARVVPYSAVPFNAVPFNVESCIRG
jgi:hypothetical protein